MGKVYIVKFTHQSNSWLLTQSGGIQVFMDPPSDELLKNLLGHNFEIFKPLIESVTLEEIPDLDYSTK